MFRILLVLAQKQDVLNLSAERTMPLTKVTLCLGNLQFGFANNNVNSAVFIFCRNYVIDTGDFVEEALPLTIKLAQWRKNWLVVLGPFPLLHMSSIQSSILCPNLFSFKWLNPIFIRVRLSQCGFMNFINTVCFGCNKN